jgi:hypothetical protein
MKREEKFNFDKVIGYSISGIFVICLLFFMVWFFGVEVWNYDGYLRQIQHQTESIQRCVADIKKIPDKNARNDALEFYMEQFHYNNVLYEKSKERLYP